MGNMIESLKNTSKSISNMTIEFVKECIKSSNYTVTTLPSSYFSYTFKNSSSLSLSSSSLPYKFLTQNFRSELQQVEGLHCILNEIQESSAPCDSKNNENSNVPIYDSKALLLIRKRKVKKNLPVIPTHKFLFNCFNCNKNLSGEDIYVYRGEWSFCNVDCRIEGIKAILDKPNKVEPRHLLSSTSSTKRASKVIFYVGD